MEELWKDEEVWKENYEKMRTVKEELNCEKDSHVDVEKEKKNCDKEDR